MKLSSIRKGAIGEMRVIIDLLLRGYDVYVPVIDDNGVDLLVVNNGNIKKVQCKSHDYPISKYQTSIVINTRGCSRADIIAVPVIPVDKVCYIKSKDVKRSVNIAYEDSVSGQKENRRWYKDYLDFPW